jgi:EmrB/QacA subfamily drug resistance transporter
MSESVDDLFARYGPRYRALVTITGMTASFTMVLMGTIVNVAVPNVMGAFGVGQDLAQFMATAFIATMTASQLLNAWFIGKFGARTTFTIVLTIFAAGALMCATAPSLDVVILGRVMQGFAAGVVQPLVMVSIIRVFPSDRRGAAMSVYAVGLVLALGLGPVVGGITIDAVGWRNIFYVPLPLVAFCLIAGSFFMPTEPDESRRKPFDFLGYGLLCVALFCLMWGIANGQRHGWNSDTIVGYLTVGLIAALAFVQSQMRANAGLLDMTVISNYKFIAAALVAMVYGIGNFSTTYAVPVFGQLVQGLTPTLAGMLLLPASIGALLALPLTGWLSDNVRTDYLIFGGLGMFALGAALLADCDVNTSFVYIAGVATITRVGMAFVTPGLMSAALGAVPEHKLNAASGTINFLRQLGGAFGINVVVALMERRGEFHADALTATQISSNSATTEYVQRAGELLFGSGHHQELTDLLALEHLSQVVKSQANTMAFQDGFMMIAAVFIFAMLPAWVMSRSNRQMVH